MYHGYGGKASSLHSVGELCALATGFREVGALAMSSLHGFFDESGTFGDPNSEYICFSGWVGRGNHWVAFSEKWDALLRAEHLDVFHSTDALGMRKEFKKWSEVKRDRLVFNLIEIIHTHVLAGLSASVSTHEFRGFPSHIRQACNNDPHYMLFETCMLGILQFLGRFDNFTLVCDDHEKRALECYRLVNKMKLRHALLRTKLASVCFADDKQHPPLQAADLWAYLNREEMERRIQAPNKSVSAFYVAITNKARMPEVKSTFYDRKSTMLKFARKPKNKNS